VISGRDGIEVAPVVVVASPIAGVGDDEELAACGCEDGLATLGLGGCELPAVEFFECNGFIFCFCFANATSLAEAFLYVISLGQVDGGGESTYTFAFCIRNFNYCRSAPLQLEGLAALSMPGQEISSPVGRRGR
jgi:hypothetical protein